MAERRMFAKTIVDSDVFLDMPLSTQALYFHLNMRADDDGFINNPKKIVRMIGSSNDDLKLLLAKSFILAFETGVIVIKHWRINNYIRSDRYKETVYTDEKSLLEVKENNGYKLKSNSGIPLYNQMDTQDSIDKISIDKNSINKNSINILLTPEEPESKIPYEEIVNYLNIKTESHYKKTSTKTQQLIRARYKEGFKLEDFKKVIDIKVQEWTGTKWEKYLRPATLFGTKFEWYLNQKDTPESKGEVMDTLEAIYNGTIRIK
mgnify:CR=1 FL=1